MRKLFDALAELEPIKRAHKRVHSMLVAESKAERLTKRNRGLQEQIARIRKSDPSLLEYQPGEYERDEIPVWKIDRAEYGGDLPRVARGKRVSNGRTLRYVTVRPGLSDDPASTERQGSNAFPWRGDLPYAETREDMQPYDIRGYSHHHGEMRRFYRGDPAVRDAIGKTVNFIARGTWEFECPEIDPDLAKRHGIDLDRIKHAAELLNLEFTLTRDIDHKEWRKIMCRDGMVEGFHISEFGIEPSDLPGYRLRWLEHRVPSSVQGWIRNERGHTIGFTQTNPNGIVRGGRGVMAAVDLRKCMYFATDWEPGNPEGVSPLRAPWSIHRLAAEYIQSALLHRKRFGTGIPFVQALRGEDLDVETMMEALDTVTDYINGQNSGLAMPDAVSFGIQDPPSDSQLIEVLEWCVKQKRMAIGAQFLDMGMDGVGSYAQGTNAMRAAMAALEGYVSGPERAFDSMIRVYCDACLDEPLTVYPVMRVRNLVVREESETIKLVTTANQMERDGARVKDINQVRDMAGFAPIEVDEAGDPDERPSMDIATATGVAQIVQQAESGQISRRAARKILESIGYEPEQSLEIIPDAQPAEPQPAQPRAAAEVPDKYAHIDFSFPDAAVAEAKRALEWREEYGRGGTEVGVRRGVQISNREAMSPDVWRRVLSYLERADGQRQSAGADWNEHEDGGPSALRIAWGLWGGDPMFAAARRVVESLDVADRDARSGCAHTATARARNVTSETRGGTFATFRALTPSETRVNLPGLEAKLNRAEESIDSAVIAVQRDHREEFAEIARPLIEAGQADRVAVLTVDKTADYYAAISGNVSDVQDFVRADMIEEIRAQVGNAAAVPQPNTQGSASQSQVDGSVALLAQRLNDDMNRRLQSGAFNAATGGGISALTRASLGVGHRTGLLVSQVVATAANEMRDQVAQDGPRVKWATYSAVMDFLTCDVCAEFDQRRYRYPSAEYEKAKPPNPRCSGFQTSGGTATPCRCIMVYEFESSDDTDLADPESGDLVTRSASAPAPVFRMICGPPTSGKSTYGAELAEQGWGVIDFDDYLFTDGERTDEPRSDAWARAMLDLARMCDEYERVAFVAPLVTRKARTQVREFVEESHPDRAVEVARVQPPTLTVMEYRNELRPESRRIEPTALFEMVASWFEEWVDNDDETLEYVQTLDIPQDRNQT